MLPIDLSDPAYATDYQALLTQFDGRADALSVGLQPVYLFTEEDEDIYVPAWFLTHKGMKERLTPPQQALLDLLYLVMRGDALETLTSSYSVLPLAEPLGLEPA